MEQTINVTYNGKTQTCNFATKLKNILPPQNPDEAQIVAAKIGNKLRSLNYPLICDANIEWLDSQSRIGNRIFKHSLSFLLYTNCKMLYPNHTLKISHSLANGMYCQLTPEKNATETVDYNLIYAEMLKMVARDLPIETLIVCKEDIISSFTQFNDLPQAQILEYSPKHLLELHTLAGYGQHFFSKMVPSTGYLKDFHIVPLAEGFVLLDSVKNSGKHFDYPKSLQEILINYSEWLEMLEIEYAKDLNNSIKNGDFQNLIMMAESVQQRKIQNIADQIHIAFPAVKFAFIAGPSSSGKTSFTNRLAIELRTLGLKPMVISMDNYFKNRTDTPIGADGEPDFENIGAMDIEYFNEQLLQLIKGETIKMPSFDFKNGCRGEKTTEVTLEEKTILLIEGIHGLNPEVSAAIADENKRKIYISCLTALNVDSLTPISTSDTREIRRLVRDIKHRGISAEGTLLSWHKVRAGEDKNIFPYQENADYHLNTALVYELPLLKTIVEPHLLSIDKNSPAFAEARRIYAITSCFLNGNQETVPAHSLLQEFLGNSIFEI